MDRGDGRPRATRASAVESRPLDPTPILPEIGFVRLTTVLRLIPVGRSTVWKWIAEGKFPSPLKLSGGVTAWRVEDVRSFLKCGCWSPPGSTTDASSGERKPAADGKGDHPSPTLRPPSTPSECIRRTVILVDDLAVALENLPKSKAEAK